MGELGENMDFYEVTITDSVQLEWPDTRYIELSYVSESELKALTDIALRHGYTVIVEAQV